MLGLYYFVHSHLGSVLQAESEEKALRLNLWEMFLYATVRILFFSRLCRLSFLQLSQITRSRKKMGNAAINDAVFAFI